MRFSLLMFCVSLSVISCDFNAESTQGELIDFIPSKSIFVLESESLSETLDDFISTDLYENNKSLPLFKELQENFRFVNYFQQDAEAFLAVTPIGERELATSLIIKDKYLSLDSVQLSKEKKIEYAGKSISEFNLEGFTFYSTLLNRVRIASESKLIIENVIRAHNNQFKFDAIFYKAHKAATGNSSLFINLEEAHYLYKNEFDQLSPKSLQGLGKWLSLDLDVSRGNLKWSGVILSQESSQKLHLFKGTSPTSFRLHEVTPTNATGFMSLSFSSFETLQKNRASQNYSATSSFKSLFENTNEVGAIQLENGALVYDMISNNVTQALDSLKVISEEESSFRNQTIYSFEPENVFADFSPLLSNHKFAVFTVYDSHFLFANKDQETLENLLVNIDNRSVLSESSSFQNAAGVMSSSAHITWAGQLDGIIDKLQKSATTDFLPNLEDLDAKAYKSVIMQASQEDSFAFVNGIIAKAKAETTSTEAIQARRIKLETDIATDPQFFINWRTRQKDIVVQDSENTLHLIDKNGKTLWTKSLDSRVVGEILTFDIFRNTRLQMAFTTQNRLYVLDKNGTNVNPFPLDFEDLVTEGLAIFDYDNNGKYRFVVVQDEDILMFNKEGKLIKGFDYKAQGPIQRTPQHIRIGRKDYILVENDLGLKILSRTASERVKPNQKLSSSANAWGLHKSSFTGTSVDGNLIEIAQNGVVQKTDLGLSKNHFTAIHAEYVVTFSENKLNINGVNKTLDYGLYLPPQIHEQSNRTFFSIVDQQANKVYLFDEQAELIPGFPVFGSSQIDLDMSKPSQLHFTVKGDDEALLLYTKNF